MAFSNFGTDRRRRHSPY
jgi:hypothetical protein